MRSAPCPLPFQSEMELFNLQFSAFPIPISEFKWLCSLPFAPCSLPYAPCSMPRALCSLPHALCPAPFAVSIRNGTIQPSIFRIPHSDFRIQMALLSAITSASPATPPRWLLPHSILFGCRPGVGSSFFPGGLRFLSDWNHRFQE